MYIYIDTDAVDDNAINDLESYDSVKDSDKTPPENPTDAKELEAEEYFDDSVAIKAKPPDQPSEDELQSDDDAEVELNEEDNAATTQG